MHSRYHPPTTHPPAHTYLPTHPPTHPPLYVPAHPLTRSPTLAQRSDDNGRSNTLRVELFSSGVPSDFDGNDDGNDEGNDDGNDGGVRHDHEEYDDANDHHDGEHGAVWKEKEEQSSALRSQASRQRGDTAVRREEAPRQRDTAMAGHRGGRRGESETVATTQRLDEIFRSLDPTLGLLDAGDNTKHPPPSVTTMATVARDDGGHAATQRVSTATLDQGIDDEVGRYAGVPHRHRLSGGGGGGGGGGPSATYSRVASRGSTNDADGESGLDESQRENPTLTPTHSDSHERTIRLGRERTAPPLALADIAEEASPRDATYPPAGGVAHGRSGEDGDVRAALTNGKGSALEEVLTQARARSSSVRREAPRGDGETAGIDRGTRSAPSEHLGATGTTSASMYDHTSAFPSNGSVRPPAGDHARHVPHLTAAAVDTILFGTHGSPAPDRMDDSHHRTQRNDAW
jgi:hypothetical protein